MSELSFFMFNFKGNTRPYYRHKYKIYDHLNQEVRSEELKTRIFDNHDIKYYRFSEILNNIESLPIVVNLIYMDDQNFHSIYAILSSTTNYSLKVLSLEDLHHSLDDYVPYENFLLYPFPSTSQLPPFNVFFSTALKRQNRTRIKEVAIESNLEIEHILMLPYSKYSIDPVTGLPKYILIHGLRVGFLEFKEFKKMLQNKKIYRFIIDDHIQQWSKSPNTLITVFGINGITYLLNANYDREKNMIYPPK